MAQATSPSILEIRHLKHFPHLLCAIPPSWTWALLILKSLPNSAIEKTVPRLPVSSRKCGNSARAVNSTTGRGSVDSEWTNHHRPSHWQWPQPLALQQYFSSRTHKAMSICFLLQRLLAFLWQGFYNRMFSLVLLLNLSTFPMPCPPTFSWPQLDCPLSVSAPRLFYLALCLLHL